MEAPATAAARPATDGIAPNTLLVVLLSSCAAMLGALPYLLFVELARFVPIVGVAAAVITVWSLRGLRLPASEEPTTGEWLLGGWSLLAYGSIASGEGFVFYALLYWGTRLVERLVRLVGGSLSLGAGRIALIGGTVFAAIFVAAVTGTETKKVLRKLHPRVAGTRSPFFPLAARWWTGALVAACLVAGAGAALVWLDPHGLWFTVGLLLALFYSSMPLSVLGDEHETTRDAARLEGKIERLLAAAGYRTTRAPVTGNAEVDPLLAPVDFLAQSGERAYAVEVKVLAAADESVDWTAASDLRTAARTLQTAMRPAEGAGVPVEPLMVLVGGRTNEALRLFADEQGVRLAHIGSAERLDEAAGLSEGGVRHQALELLGIPPGGDTVSAAGSVS